MASKRRIPPPPERRERPVVERLPDADPAPKKRKRAKSSVDVSDVEFVGLAGETESKLRRRLAEAAVAFERERFGDAIKLLTSIDKLAPGVPEVLELRGLSAYRQGRWREAIRDLTAFEEAVGTVEQHPVLADCHRARGSWAEVENLWRELGDASPSAELVEEGRIVMAGALSDQGRLREAIRLLEGAPRAPRKPKVHHLRRWYALADLYERAGDSKRARRVFTQIREVDDQFGDVSDRIRALR